MSEKKIQYMDGRKANFDDLYEKIMTHQEEHGVLPGAVEVDFVTLNALKRRRDFLIEARSLDKEGRAVSLCKPDSVLYLFGVEIIGRSTGRRCDCPGRCRD